VLLRQISVLTKYCHIGSGSEFRNRSKITRSQYSNFRTLLEKNNFARGKTKIIIFFGIGSESRAGSWEEVQLGSYEIYRLILSTKEMLERATCLI